MKRRTTRMALPQRGQCHGAQSGSGGRGSGSRPRAASSVRARGSSCLRKRLDKQAIAADAHEAFWQYMQEKATEEVYGIEGHDALLAAVRIIAPAEADALPVEGGDAVVGDGHAVGVTAEVTQDMLGPAEGRLDMGVPVLVFQLLDQVLEYGRITERGGWTSQLERSLAVEAAEPCEELVTEDSAQDWNRHQEHRMAGRDPALVIGRQSAAGNDGVDMVMGQQVRIPMCAG